MANQFINVYMNNPTEGGKDGVLVSTDGAFTSPIKIILSKSSSETIKLAIRTETGYKTKGETIIKVIDPKNENASALYTMLAWTENSFAYTEISTNDPITDTNKIFYLYSASRDLEEGKDTDITLQVSYKITAVN